MAMEPVSTSMIADSSLGSSSKDISQSEISRSILRSGLLSDTRHSSTERSSDIAPEIIVWTEDMDIDDSDPEGSTAAAAALSDETASPNPVAPLESKSYDASNSLSSSLSALTDLSRASSPLSAASSKATTPTDFGHARVQPKQEESTSILSQAPQSFVFERLGFNVRPKYSVPNDIPTRQYAAECITAAESSRLNPYALHPEEYHLLRHHISHSQVTTYLNIRNGILRLWLRKPCVGLTRSAAIGCANARWFDAASVCYDWLVRRGYINYGCVEFPVDASEAVKTSPVRRQKTIAVIGAGVSGLGCARQLECLFKQHASHFHSRGEEPPKVVLLEGRSRVGGRVYSREFKTEPTTEIPGFAGKRHTAEMGGMIITGFDRGNPVNILVRAQLGLPYHALTADTTIYDSNGQPVDPKRDGLVEQLYNDCLDRVSEFKYKFQPSKLIEGNQDLIDEGRDSPGDGSRSIFQAEEATAALPHAPPVAQQSVPEKVNMIPVSSDKLTGRVHNQPGVAATLKASQKAVQMGWDIRPNTTHADDIDLTTSAAGEKATLGSVMDSAIGQYQRLVGLNAQDHRLINWHIANLEYSNATNLHNLSLGLWDIDAGNEWEGAHTMVVGGYQSMARGLLQCPTPLNITTKFPVKSIKYGTADSTDRVVVQSEDGNDVEADAVVCTIPLGVLKQGNVSFDPPLPSWKTDVVERLGFGILNKVVLVYDRVFWESDRHIFGVLRDAPDTRSTNQTDYGTNRGRFFQWFNVSNTTGLPCLIALMAGDAGFDTEHSTNEDLVAEATQLLRGVFGKDVPQPVEAVITRWGSDRFARGSYSSAAPNMQPDDYDVMARSLGNLYFAGEHTIGSHPATVHGAYLSGLRAASEVLEAMIGPIEVPTPLILPKDSLLLQKRKQPVKDPREARLEAYEYEIWSHIHSKLGDRPIRPRKVAGNAYLLFSKAHFETARRRCEENRKAGKSRSLPNEVRMMTSRMWKEAGPEERQPYEDQAAEQKKQYAEGLEQYQTRSQEWDLRAMELRAAYENEHPSVPSAEELAFEAKTAQRHRRVKNISYMEDRDSELEA